MLLPLPFLAATTPPDPEDAAEHPPEMPAFCGARILLAEKGVAHDPVGCGQLAVHPPLDVQEARLLQDRS